MMLRLVARAILVMLVGLSSSAMALSSPHAAVPVHAAVPLASDMALPLPGIGVGAQAPPVYTGKHRVHMLELEKLLHSARGRALMHSAFGAAVVASLERQYGIKVAPGSNTTPISRLAIGAIHTTGAAVQRAQHHQRVVRVIPTLTLQAASGTAGTRLGITGARFMPGEKVSIILDGLPLAGLTASRAGTLPSGSAIALPLHAGVHALTAMGLRSHVHANARVRVYAATVAPRQAYPGSLITLRGAGFAPGQVVHVTLSQGAHAPARLGLGGTTSGGSLVPFRLYVPLATTPGRATIAVQDGAGERFSLTLVVSPARQVVGRTHQVGHTASLALRHLLSRARPAPRPVPLVIAAASRPVARPVTRQVHVRVRVQGHVAGKVPAAGRAGAVIGRTIVLRVVHAAAIVRIARAITPATPVHALAHRVTTTAHRSARRHGAARATRHAQWVVTHRVRGAQRAPTRHEVAVTQNVTIRQGVMAAHGGATPHGAARAHSATVARVASASRVTVARVASASRVTVARVASASRVTVARAGVRRYSGVRPQIVQPQVTCSPPYHQTYVGFTFDSPNCPAPDNTVSPVTVTAPGPLTIQSPSPLVLPSITVDPNTLKPTLPITLPSLVISQFGFTLSAVSATITGTGLSIAAITLTLPPAFGGGSLSGNNLAFDTSGAISGSVTFPDASITLAGFTVSVHGLTLSNSGVSVVSASLILPASLSSSGNPITLTGTNIGLDSTGSFTGSLTVTNPSVTIAGFTVAADSITLSRNGLIVANARFTIPASILPAGSSAITLTGSFTITSGFTFTGSISSGPISLVVAGFTVAVDNITLSNGGLVVTNARLTLPANLFPAGTTPITLAGNLAITAAFTFTGSLTVANPSLTIAGFTIAADSITLSNTGLVVTNARLTLPPSVLPAGASPITLTGNLTVTAGFTFTGSLATGPVSLVVAGFTVAVDNITLATDTGLVVTNARLTIPASLFPAGSSPITLTGNLAITPAFTFTGSLATGPISLAVAGFTVAADNIVLSNSGLVVTNARLTLPASLLPAGSSPITLTGNLAITAAFTFTGSLSTGPVSIPIGGFTVAVDNITLATGTGLVVTNARLTLPASLFPAGSSSITLSGNLAITPAFTVSGSLTTGPINLVIGGFTVAVDNVSLATGTGLVVTNARLTIPASVLPAGSSPITLTGNLAITPAFTVSGSLTTGPISLVIAGFTIATDGITLSNSGLVVRNARLTIPASILPAGSSAITLTGNLSITSSFSVTGSLTTGAISLTVAGFTVAADSITLATGTGLVVSNARLTLPASLLPAGSSPLTLVGNLSIDPSFHITASLSTSSINIVFGGYTVHVDSIVLNNSGLAINNATLALPAALGGGTLVGNLTVSSSFAVNGVLALAHPSFTFHGVTVVADSISLSVSIGGASSAAFKISHATVTLPQSVGGFTLTGDLTASFGSGGVQIAGQLSITNIRFSYGGFTVAVQALTLDNNGIRASGVSLTLPASFDVNGQPVVLTGALGIDISNGQATVTGSLSIPQISLSVFGFTISVTGLTLSTTGLTVQSATLTLPSGIANLIGASTVAISNLTIAPPTYQVSISIQSGLSFHLAGASVSTGPLTVGTGGLSATNASVTLPSILGGRTFTMPNLTIGSSGDTSGDVGNPNPTPQEAAQPTGKVLSFSLAGLTVSASGFSFSHGAITIGMLSASLSSLFQGGFTLQGLAFDGHNISLTGGSANISLPPINAGGFTISAQASLSIAIVNGQTTFDFIGSGTVDLASVGQLHCLVEVGSIDAAHPSNLYRAELDVQVHGAGIPIYGTPLVINGISGAIQIGAKYQRVNGQVVPIPGTSIYSFGLGLDLATDDGGFIYNGKIGASFASDGNFGFGGGGNILGGLLTVAGGFCMRFVAQPDAVCQRVLPNNGVAIDNGSATGFYAEITFGKTFHVRGDISASASAYAHIWRDSDGAEIGASVAIDISAPKGSLAKIVFVNVPPSDIHLHADATLGKFRNGNSIYRGIKFTVSISHFSKTIFVDTNGDLHLSGNDYTLIDAGNNTGYLLANLPNGTALAQRLFAHVLNAPVHSRQVVATLRLLAGQSDGAFTLVWRHGAPRLALQAPDGMLYRPNQAGTLSFRAGPRDLTDGYRGAVSILLPRLQPGIWKVIIDNLRGNEGYKFTLNAAPPRPTLRVTAPAAGRTLTASPFTVIKGTLTGPAGTAKTISLYYTTRRTTEITGSNGHLMTVPNLGGTVIAEGIPVRNGAWSYRWNTSALPASTYFVYAVLDNGPDAEVAAYGHGRVVVRQAARPAAPRAVLATTQNGQLRILWTPPAHADILAGYKLYWRSSDMAAGQYHELDLGNVHSYNLGEAREGISYAAAVKSYDLSGNESRLATAHTVPATASGSRFQATSPGGTTRAGGEITIPLALRPTGRATGRASDYVTLSVGSLPAGVFVRPTLEAANLFVPFDRADPAAPALQISTSAFASPTAPGKPDILPITVTQELTGRSVVLRVPLIIRAGAPAQLNMWYGTPTRLSNGMLSVPVVAKVVDASGGGASEGTSVTFSAVDGVVKPGDVTTVVSTPNCVTMPAALCGPKAVIKGGFAATTVVYAPGTHPYVTGDTGTARGNLYIGATPGGASRSRYFAISESQAARSRTGREVLRFRNVLDSSAHVRVDYWTLRPGDFPRERITILLVEPHGAATLPLDPATTDRQHLETVEGRAVSLGVHVISDLPVISEHLVQQGSGGTGPVLARSLGVNEEKIQSTWTFHLPAAHAVVDLYTGKTYKATVTVSARPTRGGAVSTTLALVAHGSARVDLSALLAARGAHPRGNVTVTVRASKPIAADIEP